MKTKECARIQVKQCRETLSGLRGKDLREPLRHAVAMRGLPSDEKPFRTWIDKFCGVTRAPRDPKTSAAKGLDVDLKNNMIQSLRYRCYPTEGADLTLFHEWCSKGKLFWIAAARQIQHAHASRQWERLNLLCSKKELERYMGLLAWDVPKEIRREVLARFLRAIKKGKSSEDGKGYPSAIEPPSRSTMCINFNGGGGKNYVRIDEPGSPANHHGPRGGKYRGKRELRRVGLRLSAQMAWLEFDVLFHRPLKGFPKDAKITKDGDKWHIAFSMESKLPPLTDGPRKHAGLDYNWRACGTDLSILDIGGVGLPRENFVVGFHDNRRARRQASGKSRDANGLPPFSPTPLGRRSYQKAMDARKDALKATLGIPENHGWKSIRKRAASGELSPEDQSAAEETIGWYDRALAQFKFMCGVETERRNTIYREIAQKALSYCLKHGITDVGSPDDDYKDMAEEERAINLPNWESHILNIRDRNRQAVAPGELRRIVEWTIRKAGIRIHRVNPWKTSQRCSCGADTKSRNEYFDCSGCGSRLHRSDVAVMNAATLARECCNADAHPRACSHDGKDVPYHAFAGAEEAIKKIKEAKKKARSPKRSQVQKDAEIISGAVTIGKSPLNKGDGQYGRSETISPRAKGKSPLNKGDLPLRQRQGRRWRVTTGLKSPEQG